jgi:hypothetical protein
MFAAYDVYQQERTSHMTKRLYLPVIVFVITSTLWCAIIFISTFTSGSVQAQAADPSKTDGQKWEYCSVVPFNGVLTGVGRNVGFATIYYARDGEIGVEQVESNLESTEGALKKAPGSALARAVARLGNEGW